MKTVDRYIIKQKTILLIAKTDEYGNPYTKVLEYGTVYRVNREITALIDENLRYYGSSLEGANKGAQEIFGGKTRVNPVLISEKLGIYLLPGKPSKSTDGIWFALHHVEKFFKMDKHMTGVILSDGSTVSLDIRFDTFEKKIQRTHTLKGTLEKRTGGEADFVRESLASYYIFKPPGGLSYELRDRQES